MSKYFLYVWLEQKVPNLFFYSKKTLDKHFKWLSLQKAQHLIYFSFEMIWLPRTQDLLTNLKTNKLFLATHSSIIKDKVNEFEIKYGFCLK
jgi:hypothetical protein